MLRGSKYRIVLFIVLTFVCKMTLADTMSGETSAKNILEGHRVGFLIANRFHGGETRKPMEYLEQRGAKIITVGVELGTVQSGSLEYTVERTVDEDSIVDDLDALVIPGGGSPAILRKHEEVLDFVRRFTATGKVVAAICHGPQVLISAGVLEGREATCLVLEEDEYFAVRDELVAAGAEYINEAVVRDGNIITSRHPDDIPEFKAAVAEALVGTISPLIAPEGAWIGDAGHYLSGSRNQIFLLNQEGKDFTITLHRYNWVFSDRWNSPEMPVVIIGPDGEELVNTTVEAKRTGATLEVPTNQKGVYEVRVNVGTLHYWYLTTSLSHAVIKAGPEMGTQPKAYDLTGYNATPMVPRTWYFHVPEKTSSFTLRSQSHKGRSQREDHGLEIRSPKEQRMGALWDQANPSVQDGEIVFGRDQNLSHELPVVVEPGSDGRFWSLRVQMGDAGHIWSNFPVALEGVPPYLAHSPEMWFNPETGEPAQPLIYDDNPYVRKSMPDTEEADLPHFQHWMPDAPGGRKDWQSAPALGTNAANQIRTPARFALWNPEGRELKLGLIDYLPRESLRKKGTTARLKLFDKTGKKVEELDTTPLSISIWRYYKKLEFKGVQFVEVDRIERFWAYSYPAVPIVLVGREIENDWSRFHLETGTRRNWYFQVPKGVNEFEIRVKAKFRDDVIALDINAPDRTVGRFYGHRGSTTIEVPTGLDGKIWHLSLGVGDGTRYFPAPDQPRHAVIPLELDIKGVPACLAPTWEQWFDPEDENSFMRK